MKDGFCGMEKISLVDFDGYIVTTLFTKGCNFLCPWCHNKDLVINKDIEKLDFAEIKNYLAKRKGVIDGVCITGGEPTLMPNLKCYLKELKELNLLIKLDTNGTNPDILDELIKEKLIDYVAMDIKGGLENYPKICGIKQINKENILKSIAILKSSSINYEFRTTLIKEFHDDEEIKKIANLIKGAKNYYLQKFKNSSSCIKEGFLEVKKEKALEYQSFLKNYVQNVSLRGY